MEDSVNVQPCLQLVPILPSSVTVGFDGGDGGGGGGVGLESAMPLIKVWDLDKPDRTSGHPSNTRISRASVGGRGAAENVQVTCIAVHEGLQHMVLGFQDGTIVLFRGDVTKDRHSKPKVRGKGP